MSNLDYPISVLISEAGKISTSPVPSAKSHVKQMNQLIGIKRAFIILSHEKRKDEKKERKL